MQGWPGLPLACLPVQMVLGMEVVLGAADEWRQRRPSTCNLVLLVCLLCLLQTGIDGASGGAIVTLYPSLLLFAALCNRRALLRKGCCRRTPGALLQEKVGARRFADRGRAAPAGACQRAAHLL